MSGFILPGSGGGGVSLGSATPVAISGAAGAAGASGSASHEDHVHAIAFGSDANGDIIVRAGGAYGRKGVGSNGQVLTVVSGAPDWATPAAAPVTSVGGRTGVVTLTQGGGIGITASGSDLAFKITFTSETHGSLCYFNGTAWVQLAPDTAGKVLQTNGAGAAPTWVTPSGGGAVASVGGATGTVTFSNAGGVVAGAAVGSAVPLSIGFGSDAQGDLPVRGTSAYARLAKGSADALLGVDGAGTSLAYTLTPWLTALRVGAGGSAAAASFGTGTVQAVGDATNGQAVGLKSSGVSGRGVVALYDSTDTLRGQVGYDEAGDRILVRGDTKPVVVATDAAETKVALRVEGDSFNVGVCGASAYGTSGNGVFAIGLATVAPSTNPANTMILYNSGGNGHVSCTGSMALAVGNVVKARVTSAEAALVGLVSLGQTGGSFGGAAGTAVFVKNATTNPSTNPSGGHVYYAALTSSEPLWRTSAGAVRSAVTIGAASLSGLFVAASSGGSPTRELKKRTITCSDGTTFEMLTAEP